LAVLKNPVNLVNPVETHFCQNILSVDREHEPKKCGCQTSAFDSHIFLKKLAQQQRNQ